MFGTQNSILEQANTSNSQKVISGQIEVRKLNKVIEKRIQEKWPAKRSITFLLNPYDKELDLGTKEGSQLYGAVKKGLEKEVRYDGTKEKYSYFTKLMGKAFKTFRLTDILKVPTEWEGTKPANPIKDQIVDLFQSNTVTTKQV